MPQPTRIPRGVQRVKTRQLCECVLRTRKPPARFESLPLRLISEFLFFTKLSSLGTKGPNFLVSFALFASSFVGLQVTSKARFSLYLLV
ncbi:hypothetical protein NPIL_64191 [Nephila pilipes]|uniref:Uncharacterized protein n=1 Tax=Nephila pilipes TaxID=299642 RepID=A0A8X6P4J7_NEPPI|nr:hypothetical protein NPIL_64191 [Nephila pilipes]